jgi:hypothetical protein
MNLEILVEELSGEAALINLVPKIVPGVAFDIHVHNGKPDLLDKLPGRLQGYRYWLPDDWRILVLIDEDRQDCTVQKSQLEQIAHGAGFRTRGSAQARQAYEVVNRLAIEELEAWFFGDVAAIAAAYPRIPLTLGKRARFRDPDAIPGGTWEALERVLQKAGYYPGGLPKIEAATAISEHMNPERNTSKSFQVFRDALRRMIPPPAEGAA